MKLIVIKDNYDRDYVSERWLNAPALSDDDADAVCEILNKAAGENSQDYYAAVDTDYKLWKFEP